jgi:hypothetical protein
MRLNLGISSKGTKNNNNRKTIEMGLGKNNA